MTLKMNFHSILFESAENGLPEALEPPVFFADLNLDQIVDAITLGRQEYDLKPFFYLPLGDVDAIQYRQEVMRDLEHKALMDDIYSFAREMRAVRDHLAQAGRLHFKYQKESWFLDAVEIYCAAVEGLRRDLSRHDLKSRGLRAFRAYLADYAASDRFIALLAWVKKLKEGLASVRYSLHIKGNAIRVFKSISEADYSAEVLETFAKFKLGAVKDYRIDFNEDPDMNHVEAQVLEAVAKLYPELFLDLDSFYTQNRAGLDETITRFDREIQFYVVYLEHVALFERKGLKFCYPQVSRRSKEVYDVEGFDLALAYKLVVEKAPIVCNDFYLKGRERIFVVTGPNQGGKTTFARAFGQLHYLACLGCPVPGREAQLFLFDRIFTHFEKEEDLSNLRGKLEDDLLRVHEILDQATPDSLVLINEIFTSTTLEDAIFLGKRVLDRVLQLDLLCVCVTFIDELSSLSEKTVSLVSAVAPGNPALRTYKIVRRPPDGLAYAISIAEKHRLTYDCLQERIKS